MATIDIRGASVSSADPPIATNPNPDLAIKAPVRAATTGSNITLSGIQTIDGVALAVGDRVLVKDQTDATTNGLYNAATGPWTRTIDAANNSQWARGTAIAVTDGALNSNSSFGCTGTSPILIGTSALSFAVLNTGTSGSRIPLLNGNNTWSAPQSFSVGVDNRNNFSAYNLWNFFETSNPIAMGANNLYTPFLINYQLGATGLTGFRGGLQVNLEWVAASSNTFGSAVYTAGGFGMFVQAPDGGTGTTYATCKGGFGAGNAVCVAQNGATNLFSNVGYEIDVAMQTGSSAFQKIGLLITKTSTDAVKASTVNAGICIADQVGASVAWTYGLQFGEHSSHTGAQWSLDTNSTAIGVLNPGALGTAIDFAGVTGNAGGYFLKSTNFTCNWSGAVGMNGGLTAPGTQVGVSSGIIQATATIDTGLSASVGFSRLNVGDCTHTGFFAWFDHTGARTAFMGFDTGAFVTLACNAVDAAVTGGGLFVGASPAAVGAGGIVANVGMAIGGNISASTFLSIAAATTAKSQIRLAVGGPPTSPVDGDVWFESNANTGLKVRINGVTKTVTVA